MFNLNSYNKQDIHTQDEGKTGLWTFTKTVIWYFQQFCLIIQFSRLGLFFPVSLQKYKSGKNPNLMAFGLKSLSLSWNNGSSSLPIYDYHRSRYNENRMKNTSEDFQFQESQLIE